MLLIGDDHTVIAWYVLRAESWKELTPGLYFLKGRLVRLNTLEQLEEWWTDRWCAAAAAAAVLQSLSPSSLVLHCMHAFSHSAALLTCLVHSCDGAADVTKHAIVEIFSRGEGPKSKIRRAPRKDKFHAINAVNKTGNEGVPEQKAELGSDLFGALSEIPDSELTPVVSYLMRKNPRLDLLSARTKARSDYRRDGIIRSRSFFKGEQLRRWQGVRRKWQKVFEQKRRGCERCVIRPKIGKLQGTLEEMECLEPCIGKGCLEDPWPMEEMYVDTRMQPKTGLQERLKCGESNRNESRHRVLNEIVEHVSRVGEDLMEPRIAFSIHFTNQKYDVLFGRTDEHSLSVFSWDDDALNAEAAVLLDGPPLFPAAAVPRNALPPLERIETGDARWEPLGFEYLRYLQEKKDDAVVSAALAASTAAMRADEEAAEAAAVDAALEQAVDAALEEEGAAFEEAGEMEVADADGGTDAGEEAAADGGVVAECASPSSRRRGSGGSRVTGAHKALASSPARSSPITPTSRAERLLMVKAMTEAEKQHAPGTDAFYERSAALYLEGVTLVFTNRDTAPPAGLRPNKTSASRLKAVAEGCARRCLRVEQERAHGGGSSDAATLGDDDDAAIPESMARALLQLAAPAPPLQQLAEPLPLAEPPPPTEPPPLQPPTLMHLAVLSPPLQSPLPFAVTASPPVTIEVTKRRFLTQNAKDHANHRKKIKSTRRDVTPAEVSTISTEFLPLIARVINDRAKAEAAAHGETLKFGPVRTKRPTKAETAKGAPPYTFTHMRDAILLHWPLPLQSITIGDVASDVADDVAGDVA